MKLFLIFFSLSLLAYANVCEKLFEKNYKLDNNQFIQKHDLDELNQSFNKIYDVKTVKTKIEHLDNYQNDLESSFNSYLDDIYDELDDLDISFKAYHDELESLESRLTKELASHNNRAILELKYICDELDINSVIKTNTLSDGTKIDYLVLLESKHSKRLSVKKLFEYQKVASNEIFSVDLYQNMKQGSRGFQNLAGTQIDIGFEGFKDMILYDQLTMVSKHESFHGVFKGLRNKKQDSIYHINFESKIQKPLTKLSTGYDYYMSAEEVYNFANNSFWDADFLSRTAQKLKPEMYLNKFNSISNQLDSAQSIAKQSAKLSKDFVKSLDNVLASKKLGAKFKFSLLDENKQIVKNAQDAYYFSYTDPATGHDIYSFVSQKYQEHIHSIANHKGRASFKLYEGLLEDLRDDLKVLTKVSGAMEKKAVSTQLRFEEQLSDFSKNIKKDNYLNSSNAEKLFFEIRKELRELGNVVKVNYKGFAGN